MNCIIIDDEALAIDVLTKHLKVTEGFKLLKSFQNAFEALYYVQTQSVDLVFLDIQMPRINGIQFIKILKYPPKIIITTAHKEFVLEAIEHAVVDYLLKPIPYDRFLAAVNKALELPPAKTSFNSETPITTNKFFFLKEGATSIKIFEDDICYLHGDRNYCTIHLRTGKKNVRGNLGYYGNQFSKEKFMRIHKSYFVALNCIDKYDSDSVWINGDCIPIGRTYKLALMQYLLKHTL
ncbi:MAG: DNA-binding response regulator [Cyclobacteriaceae bacterium]|nr:MAG: DNA-binding response regulator [Cyclobacteriaceae bacterium]